MRGGMFMMYLVYDPKDVLKNMGKNNVSVALAGSTSYNFCLRCIKLIFGKRVLVRKHANSNI